VASNRDTFVAIGKDAEAEIRNARAGVQALERRIAVARSQVVQLFRDEHAAFNQLKAEKWKTLRTKFVDPTTDEVVAAAQHLNAKMREIVALVKSRPDEFSTILDSFQTSADRWNELVRDFAPLGIGGNLAVAVAECDLRSNVVDALKKVIRDAFGPTSAVAEALALFTVEPWKQAPPTLAERVEARRKEFALVGEPYMP